LTHEHERGFGLVGVLWGVGFVLFAFFVFVCPPFLAFGKYIRIRHIKDLIYSNVSSYTSCYTGTILSLGGNMDWKGKSRNIYITVGASNHTDAEREKNEYYATDPIAIDVLFSVEEFHGMIWECACGEGHLSERILQYNPNVLSTDLIDRGYGFGGVDFLECESSPAMNIITNPPFKDATRFVYKGIEILPEHGKLALFLPLRFLESQERKKLFTLHPPRVLYVSSSRILCAKNGEFQKMKDSGGSAVAYGWFVWDKGIKQDTIIRWVN
jgi:hypothetical protein